MLTVLNVRTTLCMVKLTFIGRSGSRHSAIYLDWATSAGQGVEPLYGNVRTLH